MKIKKSIAAIALTAAACLCFTACSGSYGGGYWPSAIPDASEAYGNYRHGDIVEQDFKDVSKNPSSYFSLDRNTAGYALVRSQIENGSKISENSVRIEEMINYFDYDFPAPEDKAVGVTSYLSSCPWNAKNKLMLVGLKTAYYDLGEVDANYVFLVDVSGSMSGEKRLGLAQKGLNYLTDELGDNDRVSIVTYANGVKTVLDGARCTESGKRTIKNKISSLTARGGTNGGDGLDKAYKLAQNHFIKGGNNRVIIISDGDFNVGISDTNELKEFIQKKAEGGVYLSVLGVGMGNMRDDMLETLATCGNGNYAYLDNETEAKKVLVEELGGTLKTVAKDAKAGITFTQNVEKYRLIGYDTKIISEDEFNNDKTDTGEIGSNLCVTALYELALSSKTDEDAGEKLADVEVRYKDVTGETEVNESVTCEATLSTPSSDDLKFISCVAEFGLILRNSKFKGTASINAVLDRLDGLSGYISHDLYKKEFVTLVGKASESGYYKSDENKPQTQYNYKDAANEINKRATLAYGFLEDVENKDLSALVYDPDWMGAEGYYNEGYEEGDEYYVHYLVTAYPDYADGGQFVTSITCTDPEVKFYGDCTILNCDELFKYLSDEGFTVLYGSTVTAYKGNMAITYIKNKSISFVYNVENRDGIDF